MKQAQKIKELINEIVNLTKEGEINPFLAGKELDSISDYLKIVRNDVQKEAFAEAKNYHKEELKNIGVEVRSGRKIYNFDHIQEIQTAKQNLKDKESVYKLKLKELELQRNYDTPKYLPCESDEYAVIDSKTGEVCYPWVINTDTGEPEPIPIVKNTPEVVIYKNYKGN